MLMFRCHEEGVPVSEELFPAMGETNPLLKNKKASKRWIICHLCLCYEWIVVKLWPNSRWYEFIMSYLDVFNYSVVLLMSLVDMFALFEFIIELLYYWIILLNFKINGKWFWSWFYIIIIKFKFPLIPVASLYATKRFSREDTWKWQTHEKKIR